MALSRSTLSISPLKSIPFILTYLRVGAGWVHATVCWCRGQRTTRGNRFPFLPCRFWRWTSKCCQTWWQHLFLMSYLTDSHLPPRPAASLFICVCVYSCCVCILVFQDRVSLSSLGLLGTYFIDQTGLEFRDPPASASWILDAVPLPGSLSPFLTNTLFLFFCFFFPLLLYSKIFLYSWDFNRFILK